MTEGNTNRVSLRIKKRKIGIDGFPQQIEKTKIPRKSDRINITKKMNKKKKEEKMPVLDCKIKPIKPEIEDLFNELKNEKIITPVPNIVIEPKHYILIDALITKNCPFETAYNEIDSINKTMSYADVWNFWNDILFGNFLIKSNCDLNEIQLALKRQPVFCADQVEFLENIQETCFEGVVNTIKISMEMFPYRNLNDVVSKWITLKQKTSTLHQKLQIDNFKNTNLNLENEILRECQIKRKILMHSTKQLKLKVIKWENRLGIQNNTGSIDSKSIASMFIISSFNKDTKRFDLVLNKTIVGSNFDHQNVSKDVNCEIQFISDSTTHFIKIPFSVNMKNPQFEINFVNSNFHIKNLSNFLFTVNSIPLTQEESRILDMKSIINIDNIVVYFYAYELSLH